MITLKEKKNTPLSFTYFFLLLFVLVPQPPFPYTPHRRARGHMRLVESSAPKLVRVWAVYPTAEIPNSQNTARPTQFW